MITFATLVETLQQQAKEDRNITYIEGADNEVTVSYAGLYERALKRLHVLQQRGWSSGDECILFLRKNEEFVDAFWACMLGGIIPVPVAVGISEEHRSKLFKIFEKLEKPHLYTTEDNLERLQQYALSNQFPDTYDSLRANTLLVSEMESLLGTVSGSGVVHTPCPEDLAFIQFSSGSTSDPKGVMLTHENIMNNLNAIGECAQYNEQDLSLSWMPLTHDMGLIGFHLSKVAHGISQCLMSTEVFSRRPLLWMKKASEKKATILCSPNFGYKHFLKALSRKPLQNVDLSAVRLIYNGAEPISIDLCDSFLTTMSDYGLRRECMFTVYGMAEATLAVSFPTPGEPFRAVHVNRHHLNGSEPVQLLPQGDPDAISFAIVGKPVLDCRVRITNAGNTLADLQVGNIQISGPNVTRGYYKNEEANHAALTSDGWLDTGDLGFMDEGELVVTGRAKDIIFANGMNYYPHDLEALLQNISGLELGKVVVYGVWSEKLQRDELLVFVLYRSDLEEFSERVKRVSRVLSEESGLEVDHVIPVNRIPKTTSGKVQRRILSEAYSNGEYTEIVAQLASMGTPVVDSSGQTLSPIQQELIGICKVVLGDQSIGVDDSFFDAGISSLMLAEIHQQIEERYPGKVDIVDLFDHETIAMLATFLEKEAAGNLSTATG